MSFSYPYDESQFTNGVSLDDLTREVINDIKSNTLQYIDYIGTTVTFYFDSELSSSDKAILDNIVATYMPSMPPGSYTTNVDINTESYTDTTYTLVTTIQGADYLNHMTNVVVAGYITSGTGTYTLRLYDVNARMDVASATFSNTTLDTQDLGTLNVFGVIPKSLLELHCRVTGTAIVELKNLSIYYNL